MPQPSRSPIEKQAHIILKSLSAIADALERLVAVAKAAESERRPRAIQRRRKPRLSPQRRTALKLQGLYMAYLKKLKPRQQAQVKALRAKKGFAAAIAMAKRMAKGRSHGRWS